MIQAKTISSTEVSLKFKPFPTNELNAGDKVVGYKIYRGTAKDNVEGIGEVSTVKPDAEGYINYTDKKNLEPGKTYLYAVSAIVERENVKIEGAAEDLVGYWHASMWSDKGGAASCITGAYSRRPLVAVAVSAAKGEGG